MWSNVLCMELFTKSLISERMESKIVFSDAIIRMVTLCLPLLLLLYMLTESTAIFLVVLAVCVVFITKPEVVFPIYWVASLSSQFVVVDEGLSAGRFLSVIMIVSLLILFYNKNSRVSKQRFCFFVAIVVFTFLSALFSITHSLQSFFVMMLNLLVFFLMSVANGIDYERVVKNVAISSFFVLLYFSYTAYLEGAFLFASRFLEDGKEDGPNANRIAMLITQCGTVLCAYLVCRRSIILNAFSIMGVVLSIFLVVALGSRAALLALIAGIVFCMYFVLLHCNAKSNTIILFVFLLLFFVLFVFFSTIDSSLIDRFSLESLEDDGGGGRLTNIKIIMGRIFPEYPLFGTGIGGENVMDVGKSYNLPNLAHNFVIDPLAQMGIFGYTLYLIFLCPYVIRILKLIKLKNHFFVLLSLAPLVAAITNGIGEVVFFEKFFWNDLGLCYLAYKYYIEKGKYGNALKKQIIS